MKLISIILFLLAFNTYAQNQIKPKKDNYRGAVSITPNDSASLTDPVSAIYVGGAGNIKLTTIAGDTVTLISVSTSTVLDIATTKVFSTSTTATNLIGLK